MIYVYIFAPWGSVQGLSISHGVVKLKILLKDQVSSVTHFSRMFEGNAM
jgi:hypothetical protein